MAKITPEALYRCPECKSVDSVRVNAWKDGRLIDVDYFPDEIGYCTDCDTPVHPESNND